MSLFQITSTRWAMTSDEIPDNSLTIVLKYKGKFYSQGHLISELSTDDNLFDTLDKLHRSVQVMRNTIFNNLAKREGEPHNFYQRIKKSRYHERAKTLASRRPSNYDSKDKGDSNGS